MYTCTVKIFYPPSPVLRAEHPVSCFCVCVLFVLYGLVRWVPFSSVLELSVCYTRLSMNVNMYIHVYTVHVVVVGECDATTNQACLGYTGIGCCRATGTNVGQPA